MMRMVVAHISITHSEHIERFAYRANVAASLNVDSPNTGYA